MSVAMKVAETSETIFVEGDTDLMKLLCHHASTDQKRIYFHPYSKTRQDVLLANATLGCDTTSRLFGFAKAIALKLIQVSQTCFK